MVEIEVSEKNKIDGVLTRAELEGVSKGDGGIIDNLLSSILKYLKNNVKSFSLSDGNYTDIEFVLYFPYDKFESLPMVAIDVTNSKIKPSFIGGITYVDDLNTPIPTVRGDVEVVFDVIARNSRQKEAIVGVISNALYRGLYDGSLTKYGILNIFFNRSINRGMEQADKVLQFHTHQLITDTVFRHILDYTFSFISPVTYPVALSIDDEYFIHDIGVTEEDNYFAMTLSENSLFLELDFTYNSS